MGPLAIFQGMALALVAAPNCDARLVRERLPVSIAAYSLPAAASSPPLTALAQSERDKPLAPVPMNDAVELPKFTFRDGGVMEIGGGGLKLGWRF